MVCKCKKSHWMGHCERCDQRFVEHNTRYYFSGPTCPLCKAPISLLCETEMIKVTCRNCTRKSLMWEGDKFHCEHCKGSLYLKDEK